MLDSDPHIEIEYPQLSANYNREVYVSSPTWRDVPEVRTVSRNDVRNVVIGTIDGLYNNGAAQRCKAITEVAYHYRRYRRTCCTPKRSRIEATKQAADQLGITPQAVRSHLRTLRTDDGNTDSVVEHLEIIDHRIAEQSTPLGRQLRQTCERLVRVLDKIAAIDQTPSIEPTDIRIEDTKMDHPNKRRRILDADNESVS